MVPRVRVGQQWGGGSNFTKAYVYVYKENLKKKIFSQKLLASIPRLNYQCLFGLIFQIINIHMQYFSNKY